MMRLNQADASHSGNASLALRVEAYLASLHEPWANNLKAALAKGMAPAKMQRIARDTSTGRQPEAYSCLSS